jgi:hypothetical protein
MNRGHLRYVVIASLLSGAVVLIISLQSNGAEELVHNRATLMKEADASPSVIQTDQTTAAESPMKKSFASLLSTWIVTFLRRRLTHMASRVC